MQSLMMPEAKKFSLFVHGNFPHVLEGDGGDGLDGDGHVGQGSASGIYWSRDPWSVISLYMLYLS